MFWIIRICIRNHAHQETHDSYLEMSSLNFVTVWFLMREWECSFLIICGVLLFQGEELLLRGLIFFMFFMVIILFIFSNQLLILLPFLTLNNIKAAWDCFIVCLVEGPHESSKPNYLLSIDYCLCDCRELFCINIYQNIVHPLSVTKFACLFICFCHDFWFLVCLCAVEINGLLIVCRDALFCSTQFKVLGIDLHAALLPEDSHSSFTWIWDFV